MLKNIMGVVKSVHLDGGRPTWVNVNGNIIQPRVYRTMKGYGDYKWGNIYDATVHNDLHRFGAQLGRFVFTTEPKGK